MSNVIKQEKRVLPPDGTHNAVLYAVWDIGLQPGYQGGPAKEQYILAFEIEEEYKGGQRFTVSKKVTKSLHKKATLSSYLKGFLEDYYFGKMLLFAT